MTYQVPVLVQTYKAAGDLSAKQFYFVKLSAADTVDVCSAATDKAVGVLQNKPDAANKAAEVMLLGVSKVSSDAALSRMDLIGPSADGQADAKTPGTDTTEYVHGMVLEASGGAGQLAAAFICCVPLRAA